MVDGAVSQISVIQTVVKIAGTILRGDKMHGALAVGHVFQIRAVAALSVEPVAAVRPRLAVVLRDHIVGLMMKAAKEVEHASVEWSKRVGIGVVVAGIVGVG